MKLFSTPKVRSGAGWAYLLAAALMGFGFVLIVGPVMGVPFPQNRDVGLVLEAGGFFIIVGMAGRAVRRL